MKTFWDGLRQGVTGLVLIALFVGLVIFFFGFAPIWWKGFFGVRKENVKTDVLHQSNQYTTSQVTRLNTLYTNYMQLEGLVRTTTDGQALSGFYGQQRAIINEMHSIVGTIPEERVPADIALFIVNHPRGSR